MASHYIGCELIKVHCGPEAPSSFVFAGRYLEMQAKQANLISDSITV